jgi:molybdate transport system substrate-binding protein
MDQLQEKGLVSKASFMAWHVVAILISPEMKEKIYSIDDLAAEGIRLAISNPRLASLGQIVMDKIINKHPEGKKILNNIVVYGSSSQDILKIYRSGDIDAIIEWDVMASTPEGKELTVITIDTPYAVKDKLMIGLLTTSKYPQQAEHFFQYLLHEGKKTFLKHGYDVNEFPQATDQHGKTTF